MIAVIADDLTGAAEIGGLGLKYDLEIQIATTANLSSTTDLLIICTDTRSMPQQQALEVTEKITTALVKLKPSIIFKKTDSVLRGHVIAELEIHLQQLGFNKALLVPANPEFGRTIHDGYYFINNKPIHLTSFAHDPEFAMKSNKIHDMLRVTEDNTHLRNHTDELPGSGIIVGNCETKDDLAAWVNKLDNETLLAGGAGIFATLLESLNLKKRAPINEVARQNEQLKLFICGSTQDTSRQLVKNVIKKNGPVSYMPAEIITLAKNGEDPFDNWADEIVSLLKTHKRAIVAINENTTNNIAITAVELRNRKAKVIEKVFQKIAVDELLVEGGSTAAAIIKRLNFINFFPVAELGPGVIKMKVEAIENLFLTLKPGSYKWPVNTWDF